MAGILPSIADPETELLPQAVELVKKAAINAVTTRAGCDSDANHPRNCVECVPQQVPRMIAHLYASGVDHLDGPDDMFYQLVKELQSKNGLIEHNESL
jgi:hypothetical protein